MKIAIAGDLHGAWSKKDIEILTRLNPDAVFFVGDLGESDIKPALLIKQISCPTAVILGNHDRGNDRTGEFLKTHLKILSGIHCGWSMKQWPGLPLAVVGCRPCSPGGGFYLSPEVQSVFGCISTEESASRIVSAAFAAPLDVPLVLLAHSGPTGLGSQPHSPCGRDWKTPSLDWGDQDLSLAINQIRKKRIPELVVFGHMHHQLRQTNKLRTTLVVDSFGTKYLNAACVPRIFKDENGNTLFHFSWIEFNGSELVYISHRWFKDDSSIAYEEILFEK